MALLQHWQRDSRLYGRASPGNLAHVKKNDNPPHTLVINADNGPENSGVRTQWLKRMMKFSVQNEITVQLAYYPPYHSKYNPIERVFGVLETYWNGTPLRTVECAMGMAQGMTYRGVHPVASLHEGGTKGVRVVSKGMKILERGLERMEDLKKWFVKIVPEKAKAALDKLKNL